MGRRERDTIKHEEKRVARKVISNWEHNERLLQITSTMIMNDNSQQQNPPLVQQIPSPRPVVRNEPSLSQNRTEGIITALHGTNFDNEEQVKRQRKLSNTDMGVGNHS